MNILKFNIFLVLLVSSQAVSARRGDFSPQNIFFLPLILIGVLSLFKFSGFIENYTKGLNLTLRVVIKAVSFIILIGIIALIIIGIGLISEYIPEKWSMIF
ncbi:MULTISPECIES: hypothetical protein [unclassified Acinetobacter]|uniref:hypothetical protein n=1 Tax=unclassified Acinetobacter TaxID=196816 RepID=UPI0015D3D2FF|nr:MULTISPECIES: hypothetical protein [unclassified Acinetobacter]